MHNSLRWESNHNLNVCFDYMGSASIFSYWPICFQLYNCFFFLRILDAWEISKVLRTGGSIKPTIHAFSTLARHMYFKFRQPLPFVSKVYYPGCLELFLLPMILLTWHSKHLNFAKWKLGIDCISLENCRRRIIRGGKRRRRFQLWMVGRDWNARGIRNGCH